MIRTLILAVGIAAALATSPVAAKQRTWPADQLGKETSIPFVNTNGIYNFQPDGEHGVWLQDRQRRWYYARVLGPCLDLPSAIRIGVDTRFGGSSLDRTGTLLVDREHCPLSSLTTSNGPPPKPKKAKKG
ncbi:MAG: DUF6491 family protein [Sphingomonas sp.]